MEIQPSKLPGRLCRQASEPSSDAEDIRLHNNSVCDWQAARSLYIGQACDNYKEPSLMLLLSQQGRAIHLFQFGTQLATQTID